MRIDETVQLNVRVPEGVRRGLRLQALKNSVSIEALVLEYLRRGLAADEAEGRDK